MSSSASDSASGPAGGAARSASAQPLRDRVEAVLSLIRPAIQSDGGDVELVGVDEGGRVIVRLLGACVGCPSSAVTLQMGLERQLKARIPEVTCVEAVG